MPSLEQNSLYKIFHIVRIKLANLHSKIKISLFSVLVYEKFFSFHSELNYFIFDTISQLSITSVYKRPFLMSWHLFFFNS